MAVPLIFTAGTAAGGGGSSSGLLPPMSSSNKPEFSHPTRIDNRLFPLKPGTEWVYEGTVTEAGEQTPHRVVFTVTSLTKVIGGVRTRVAWDRDFSDGELQETELAFFAQDDKGTVWRFGEYPEEHENGQFVGARRLDHRHGRSPRRYLHARPPQGRGRLCPGAGAPDRVL
jgi:uncharacterized protein YbaA (DUF1428 family)